MLVVARERKRRMKTAVLSLPYRRFPTHSVLVFSWVLTREHCEVEAVNLYFSFASRQGKDYEEEEKELQEEYKKKYKCRR